MTTRDEAADGILFEPLVPLDLMYSPVADVDPLDFGIFSHQFQGAMVRVIMPIENKMEVAACLCPCSVRHLRNAS
jgi:hypothetical protein